MTGPVFPTHLSTPAHLCVSCGVKPHGHCLGVARRKLYRLQESIQREERRVARGGPKNAGLVAALQADANILREEVERIVRMEKERDEVQS